jgi:hypothetical protein
MIAKMKMIVMMKMKMKMNIIVDDIHMMMKIIKINTIDDMDITIDDMDIEIMVTITDIIEKKKLLLYIIYNKYKPFSNAKLQFPHYKLIYFFNFF